MKNYQKCMSGKANNVETKEIESDHLTTAKVNTRNYFFKKSEVLKILQF
jgi:hypothetical protein